MRLKYVGTGFVSGVPARDLEEDEIKALGVDWKVLVRGGLYVPVEEQSVGEEKATTDEHRWTQMKTSKVRREDKRLVVVVEDKVEPTTDEDGWTQISKEE